MIANSPPSFVRFVRFVVVLSGPIWSGTKNVTAPVNSRARVSTRRDRIAAVSHSVFSRISRNRARIASLLRSSRSCSLIANSSGGQPGRVEPAPHYACFRSPNDATIAVGFPLGSGATGSAFPLWATAVRRLIDLFAPRRRAKAATQSSGDAIETHTGGLRTNRKSIPDRPPTQTVLHHLHESALGYRKSLNKLRALIGQVDRFHKIVRRLNEASRTARWRRCRARMVWTDPRASLPTTLVDHSLIDCAEDVGAHVIHFDRQPPTPQFQQHSLQDILGIDRRAAIRAFMDATLDPI